MANGDWRQVYREEVRRPAYVIENGKTPVRIDAKPKANQEATAQSNPHRRAA